jgi:UDP-hydrolysing UDP-N-acetyl-D-glucosamine 2-epimerase
MGENTKFVFNTGSLSIDEVVKEKITSKKKLEKKYGFKFTNNEILLVQHPVTTEIEKSKKQIKISLNALIKTKKNIISISPNMDPGNKIIFKNLEELSKKYERVRYFQNVPRADYLGFLKNCIVLIGNSSSGIVESTMFDIQVINLGIRQNGREKENSVIDIKIPTVDKIYTEIMKIFSVTKRNKKRKIHGSGNASKKIIRHLENLSINEKLIQKQFNN